MIHLMKGIKELRMDTEGLYLYCNDETKFTIALFEGERSKNKYNGLSIEYRGNMIKPELMVFNVKTWEPVWKYLELDIFHTFDRIYSIESSTTNEFIYLSSVTGLEFKYGTNLGNIFR